VYSPRPQAQTPLLRSPNLLQPLDSPCEPYVAWRAAAPLAGIRGDQAIQQSTLRTLPPAPIGECLLEALKASIPGKPSTPTAVAPPAKNRTCSRLGARQPASRFSPSCPHIKHPARLFRVSRRLSFLISTLTQQHQPTRRPDDYTAPRQLLVHREAPTAKR
jgi:hypothetical protein